MRTIRIVCVGKLGESYLRAGCAEYSKRLGAFCKLTVAEIGEERLPKDPSAKEIERALEREGERVLAAIPQGGCTVAMCVEGDAMTSEDLAAWFQAEEGRGHSRFTFLIGGSHGLSDAAKRAADLRLSLSRMTFPHQLFRLMLLEQVYRASMIGAGHRYHK